MAVTLCYPLLIRKKKMALIYQVVLSLGKVYISNKEFYFKTTVRYPLQDYAFFFRTPIFISLSGLLAKSQPVAWSRDMMVQSQLNPFV